MYNQPHASREKVPKYKLTKVAREDELQSLQTESIKKVTLSPKTDPSKSVHVLKSERM